MKQVGLDYGSLNIMLAKQVSEMEEQIIKLNQLVDILEMEVTALEEEVRCLS